jgi:hypothetical protein
MSPAQKTRVRNLVRVGEVSNQLSLSLRQTPTDDLAKVHPASGWAE